MKKIKNYMLALYVSGVVGLGTAGYFGYNSIKDNITVKTSNICGIGLFTTTALLITGAIGFAANGPHTDFEKQEQNELEEMLK